MSPRTASDHLILMGNAAWRGMFTTRRFTIRSGAQGRGEREPATQMGRDIPEGGRNRRSALPITLFEGTRLLRKPIEPSKPEA